MKITENTAIYEYVTNKYLRLIYDFDLYRDQNIIAERNNDYGHSTIHYSEEMGSLWGVRIGVDRWIFVYSDPKSYHFMSEAEVIEQFSLYRAYIEGERRRLRVGFTAEGRSTFL